MRVAGRGRPGAEHPGNRYPVPMSENTRWDDLAERLRFDPTEGRVIRRPPGFGYGYWTGGCKVTYDPDSGRFVLYYRERSPLERGRGERCRVAVGEDGVRFTDVWSADRRRLAAGSIEAGHAVRHDADEWRLYLSYEMAGTSTWRIDMMSAPDPSRFKAQSRRTVIQPGHFGLRFIKDPWIIRQPDGGYHLYAAVPARTGPTAAGDRIVIGAEDATVRAASADGVYFETLEYVYEAAGDGSWHGHRGRLDGLFPYQGGWVGTFSGGRTMFDNYEEPCGLLAGPSPDEMRRLDAGGPWIESPYGCVRYVFGVPVDGSVFFYYEYARQDGSHELRVSQV